MSENLLLAGFYLEEVEKKLKEALSDVQTAMEFIGHRKYVPPVRPENPFPDMKIGDVLTFDRRWTGWLEERRCYQKKKTPERKFKFKSRGRESLTITRVE